LLTAADGITLSNVLPVVDGVTMAYLIIVVDRFTPSNQYAQRHVRCRLSQPKGWRSKTVTIETAKLT
jgi:hypothetical protein